MIARRLVKNYKISHFEFLTFQRNLFERENRFCRKGRKELRDLARCGNVFEVKKNGVPVKRGITTALQSILLLISKMILLPVINRFESRNRFLEERDFLFAFATTNIDDVDDFLRGIRKGRRCLCLDSQRAFTTSRHGKIRAIVL